LVYLGTLSPQWFGLTVGPNAGLHVSFLQSLKHLLAYFLTMPGRGILLAFLPLLLLVLLVAILRKQWLAIAALWAVYFSFFGLSFASSEHWTTWLWVVAIATLMVVCISRFGLLAMVSSQVFFHLTFFNVLTANVSSWYFGNTIFAAVVLLGLAIYGFYTSLAGQPLLKGKLLVD
jgi:hypothetical protein